MCEDRIGYDRIVALSCHHPLVLAVMPKLPPPPPIPGLPGIVPSLTETPKSGVPANGIWGRWHLQL